MPSLLDKQLAQFLRRTRGDQTLAEFSRKLGLPPSAFHRLAACEQSITPGRLQQIMTRLKCGLMDISPGRAKLRAANERELVASSNLRRDAIQGQLDPV